MTDTSSLLIDLVVLDIAGTTVEEYGAVYTALQDATEAAGAAPSRERLERWMGADKHQAVAELLRGDPDAPAADPERVENAYADFRVRLARAYRSRPPRPIDGAVEAIGRLRAGGVRVALTTGFTRDITTSLLAVVGWEGGVVDAVVTVDDVTAGRPAPYMIFHAMEATGTTDVARVLVAGDTTRDLEAGTNARVGFVVGVLTGGHDAEKLGAVPHTHILNSVADLPDLLLPLGVHPAG